MVMPVDPGGAYFGFYSDFGDDSRGEVISYSSAVASVSAPGARDVVDIEIPDGLGSPTTFSGHPQIQSVAGTGSTISIITTYDNGYWDDGAPPFYASNFLVQLLGPEAESFEISPGLQYSISHYVSSDGGQTIQLSSITGLLLSGLTRIKVWRAEVFPGDDPTEFWTGFVGSREII